jgi:allophanate hydrolase subunit 2
MDPVSLAFANASVGNAPGAPALEITLAGPELEALGDAFVSPGRPVRAGERIRIGRVERGARTYLALAGGFVDPRHPGEPTRRLSEGDVLSAGDARPFPSTPLPALELSDEIPLRVVLGPESGDFAPEQIARFLETPWRVTPESDRRGLRLEGPRLAHLGAPEIAPSGTVPGTIQVPGSGLPIVLGPDGPVTGGYPRIAAVVGADLWRLGQARPGATLRLLEVTFREAVSVRRAGGSTITLP